VLNSILKSEIRLGHNSLGELTGLMSRINSLMAPAAPVTAENCHVRVMYLASDKINAHGGRFGLQELHRLTELIPGAPVMVRHRHDRLPIARCFHADSFTGDDGVNWVRSYFYWMKDSDNASTLQTNIDSGIYQDCSLCFSFTTPECSVCGEDIRRCPHLPLQPYTATDGSEAVSFYYYRGIIRVVEISLVYRGANPGTRIANLEAKPDKMLEGIALKVRSDFGEFDLGIYCGDSLPPALHHDYRCSYLERNTGARRGGYRFVECSSFLEISDGVPRLLIIEDSVLRGKYRFLRLKSDGKYQLLIRREE